MSGLPNRPLVYGTLIRSFLRRFFENEITGGREDLKLMFFWLLAVFTAPLTLLPVTLMVRYQSILVRYGPDALREFSRSGKVIAITLGMSAAGLVAVMVWHSLMLERRDGLVLGVLPVRGRDVVLSKLAALAIYILGIAVSMNLLSSLLFGLILADGASTTWFVVMSPIAHFTATVTASAFVFLTVAAVQGTALAMAGPNLHRRISSVCQVMLVVGVVLAVTHVSSVTQTVVEWANGDRPPAWLMWAPPVWFLGLYEWMLGGAEPVYVMLALRAGTALGVAAVLTVATYVIVYWRVMTRVAETPEEGVGGRLTSWMADAMAGGLSRRPVRRAAVQFFALSLSRVTRLRFVVATTVGLLVAWILPMLAAIASSGEPSLRSTFALSHAALFLSVFGVRIAVSMPADLRASWVVQAVDASPSLLRSGLWRATVTTAVLPIVVLVGALHVFQWGWPTALRHAGVMTATGALVVEVALWHFDDLPFRRPWRPESANLRTWWSVYVFGFAAITTTLAQLEWLARDSLGGSALIATGLVAATILVRVAHNQPYPPPDTEVETFVETPHVLKLD